MDKQRSGYVELARIIVARNLDVPPDDVDMAAIFDCVTRAIEEKVENDLSDDEVALTPRNRREIQAIVSPIGEAVVPMMFRGDYPFEGFVEKYENWYAENLAMEFLKIKLESMHDKGK